MEFPNPTAFSLAGGGRENLEYLIERIEFEEGYREKAEVCIEAANLILSTPIPYLSADHFMQRAVVYSNLYAGL